MTVPTITTIIPAYRAARTIRRAVDSVLGQTRPPDETVVVDDGSPDDLPAVLRPYGDRLTLFRKPNGGAASARNTGIEQARGQLLTFLDADDYWEPRKLEHQLQVLERHPEVGLIAGRSFVQMPGEPRQGPLIPLGPDLDRVLRGSGERAFALATLIWTSTVLVRREVLGDHRFDRGLSTGEDRDLWVRLVTGTPVYLLSEPLATGVLEPGSLSRSNVDRDFANMLQVVRRHGGLLGRHGLRKWEARAYREWAATHLGNGRPGAGLAPAWQRFRRQPFSPQAWWIVLKCALWGRTTRRPARFFEPCPHGDRS